MEKCRRNLKKNVWNISFLCTFKQGNSNESCFLCLFKPSFSVSLSIVHSAKRHYAFKIPKFFSKCVKKRNNMDAVSMNDTNLCHVLSQFSMFSVSFRRENKTKY